jgi:xanthine dehydrogenase accessory factor
MNGRLAPTLQALLAADQPAALVTVVVAKGSTPREAGVAMLVTADRAFGTIGGGRLEWEGLARARELLATEGDAIQVELPLGPAVGQCCGGHVTLYVRRADGAVLAELEAAEAEAEAGLPLVLLFGAGHVGRALARALAPLPLRLRWIDSRGDEFPVPPVEGPEAVVTDRPLLEIERAPAGSAFFVLTHSHALDFTLCSAVLERGDFAYLGLIGSATKRARFERGFRELGIPAERLARLACPIGGSALRDKRPAVIAVLAAAELLVTLAASSGDAAATTKDAAARAAGERAA